MLQTYYDYACASDISCSMHCNVAVLLSVLWQSYRNDKNFMTGGENEMNFCKSFLFSLACM